MGEFIIKNEIELEKYLSRIVREATSDAMVSTGRDERRRQRSADDRAKDFRKQGTKDEVDEAEEEETEVEEKGKEVPSADVKKPSESKVAQADLKDIVKTLNVMRSGRSTKDPDVQKALKSYVDGLTTGEQQSLYAFLSGLAEMMVGGEGGKDATDPHTIGLKTKPIADKEEVKVTVKAREKKGTEEAPIVVGEHANKSRERMRFRQLMRG